MKTNDKYTIPSLNRVKLDASVTVTISHNRDEFVMRSFRKFLNISLVVISILIAPVSAFAAQVVDINRADAAAMIENWKGIGEKKASAIVSYRKSNGPFASIDDLANVKGIGEGIIKNNRKLMSVSKGVFKATGKKQNSTSKDTKATSKKTSSTDSKKKTKDSSSSKKSTSKKSDSNTSAETKSSKKKSKSKKSSSKTTKKKKCKPGSKDKACKAKKSKKKKSTT